MKGVRANPPSAEEIAVENARLGTFPDEEDPVQEVRRLRRMKRAGTRGPEPRCGWRVCGTGAPEPTVWLEGVWHRGAGADCVAGGCVAQGSWSRLCGWRVCGAYSKAVSWRIRTHRLQCAQITPTWKHEKETEWLKGAACTEV
eukprot:129893-Chlamydomonas_euryale.AAC.2